MPIRPDVIGKRVCVFEAQLQVYLDADARRVVRSALIRPRRCYGELDAPSDASVGLR
jgi:hypothetical protein